MKVEVRRRNLEKLITFIYAIVVVLAPVVIFFYVKELMEYLHPIFSGGMLLLILVTAFFIYKFFRALKNFLSISNRKSIIFERLGKNFVSAVDAISSKGAPLISKIKDRLILAPYYSYDLSCGPENELVTKINTSLNKTVSEKWPD